MKQNVFHYKFNVDADGEPLAFNLNDEIEKLSVEGWNIKQIHHVWLTYTSPNRHQKVFSTSCYLQKRAYSLFASLSEFPCMTQVFITFQFHIGAL